MGIFFTTPQERIAKELKSLNDITDVENFNQKQIGELRSLLTSINTRIKNGTLSVTGENKRKIEEIEKLIRKVEDEEEQSKIAIQKINNLMLQIK